MRRISQFLTFFLFASVAAFSSDDAIQNGAQMMLKIAAAELLEELTDGQIPKPDLMRFAAGMTEKYPDLYTISDTEAERLLADEPLATEDSFQGQIELYSKSGHTATDLLMLILNKHQSQMLNHSQTAFAFQYLKALNQDIVARSVESTSGQ